MLQQARVRTFAVNETYVIDPDIHVTVNPEWWDYNWERHPPVQKLHDHGRAWCSDPATCRKYGLKAFGWFDDQSSYGLSADPSRVHLGHSSGFAALNIAYLMGCNPIALIGHDMKYPKDYDARAKKPGGARHYFGEYAAPLQHWPSVKVDPKTKALTGLIECYEGVVRQNPPVTIVNITPGSALECFPTATTQEFLDGIRI